jgi:hypothetical protein
MKFREVTSDEWRTHLRARDRVFQRRRGPVSSWRAWTVGRVKRAVYRQEMHLRGDGLPKKILPLAIAVAASEPAAEKHAARLCDALLAEGYVETTAERPGRQRRRPSKPATPGDTRFAHASPCTALALDAAGRVLVSAHRDGKVRVWDVARGHCVRTMGAHRGPATAVCVDARGAVAVSAGRDGRAVVWDLRGGKRLRAFDVGGGTIALAPGGRWMVVASWSGALARWDVRTGEPLGACGDEDHLNVASLSVSADERLVACANEVGEVAVWSAKGALRWRQPFARGFGAHVAFAPRGGALLAGATRVALLDGRTGERTRELLGAKDTVHHVAWTRGGRPVCACEDGRTIAWGPAGRGAAAVLGEQRYVPGALCAARDLVATAGDRALHAWRC